MRLCLHLYLAELNFSWILFLFFSISTFNSVRFKLFCGNFFSLFLYCMYPDKSVDFICPEFLYTIEVYTNDISEWHSKLPAKEQRNKRVLCCSVPRLWFAFRRKRISSLFLFFRNFIYFILFFPRLFRFTRQIIENDMRRRISELLRLSLSLCVCCIWSSKID